MIYTIDLGMFQNLLRLLNLQGFSLTNLLSSIYNFETQASSSSEHPKVQLNIPKFTLPQTTSQKKGNYFHSFPLCSLNMNFS